MCVFVDAILWDSPVPNFQHRNTFMNDDDDDDVKTNAIIREISILVWKLISSNVEIRNLATHQPFTMHDCETFDKELTNQINFLRRISLNFRLKDKGEIQTTHNCRSLSIPCLHNV